MNRVTAWTVWTIFILLAGIVSLLASLVFAFGSWKEFQMCSVRHNSVVAETIYILGVGMELQRPACPGEEQPATLVEMSRSSSMVSIFGFGHDDTLKWTFARRRPLPRDDPAKEGTEDNNEKN